MRKITVLIVDDEITVLQGLKNLFDWEKNGYAIVGAAMDGISALNQAFEIRPDIVLMDINMPLMSGLDVVSRIRESLPRTVTIMISGYSDAHYMRQAIRHGVFDYILKPISFEDLSETLERARMHILGESQPAEISPEQDKTVIQHLVSYLNDHISEEVSLKVLSDRFHMNPNYISKYFKNETGMNYSAYLLALRINRAKKLLGNSDRSVAEVAQMTGFKDYRFFSRTFTQETGMKPSQYRANNRMD